MTRPEDLAVSFDQPEGELLQVVLLADVLQLLAAERERCAALVDAATEECRAGGRRVDRHWNQRFADHVAAEVLVEVAARIRQP